MVDVRRRLILTRRALVILSRAIWSQRLKLTPFLTLKKVLSDVAHPATVPYRPLRPTFCSVITWRGPLRDELNDSRFEVVHRTCNLDAACRFELSKHRA